MRPLKAKVLNGLGVALAILLTLGAAAPDAIVLLGDAIKLVPGGSKTAAVLGLLLAFMTRLPSITKSVVDVIAKLKGTLLFLAAVNLGMPGCAWLSTTRGKQIQCAAIVTVENAPQLVAIVGTCATVAVTATAIVPCIQGAAGSQWANDVIACFTASAAGITRCPAVGEQRMGLAPEAATRLRGAVLAQDWVFAP